MHSLKSTRSVDFLGKSSGFADFENTVHRGSAVNCGADSGSCVSMFGSWVLNEIWIVNLFSAFGGVHPNYFEHSSFNCQVWDCYWNRRIEQKYWRIDGFGVKKARIFASAVHP